MPGEKTMTITRRQFVHIGAGTCVALIAPRILGCGGEGSGVNPAPTGTSVWAVVGDSLTELYEMGKQAAIKLGITGSSLKGSTVFIKPNFLTMGISGMANPITGETCKPEIVAAVAEPEVTTPCDQIIDGAHVPELDPNLCAICGKALPYDCVHRAMSGGADNILHSVRR